MGSRLVIIYYISRILVIVPSLLAESAAPPASASAWFVDFKVVAVYSLRTGVGLLVDLVCFGLSGQIRSTKQTKQTKQTK